MGARASVVFQNGNDKSPVICDHWGNSDFHDEAKAFVDLLKKQNKEAKYPGQKPIQRGEPGYIMVAFIAHLATQGYDLSSTYIERDESMVDDSDNGCYVADVSKL